MKRIFTIFNLLAICLISSATQYELTLADVDFNKATGTITAYKNTTEKNIIIPEKLDGVDVTKIAQAAFARKELTGVSIPTTVNTIDGEAFLSNNLIEIVIPRSVNTIKYDAFAFNKIEKITLPSTVKELGNGVFNHNLISQINGYSSKGIIYARHPNGNDDKSKIISYGGVSKTIDFIPNMVRTIGEYAFYGNALTGITIPNTITSIEKYAFHYNELTLVNIPNSISTLSKDVFSRNKLTNVTIPSNIISIEESAFGRNTSLAEIVLPTDQNGYSMEWKKQGGTVVDKITDFYKSYSSTVNTTPLEYTITYHTNGGTHTNPATYNVETETITLVAPDGNGENFVAWYSNANISGARVTEIAKGSFGNINLYARYEGTPYTLTIDDVYFYKSTGTIARFDNNIEKDIIIPEQLDGTNVTTINKTVFWGKGLEKVVIPNTVKSIGELAFWNNNLSSVIIPNSVTNIGERAFNKNKITKLNGASTNGIIYARKAEGGEDRTKIIGYGGTSAIIDFIPNTVTTIDTYAFFVKPLYTSDKGHITHVTIPNSVTTIGNDAFLSNSIEELILGNAVESIGWSAFRDNQLTELIIPNSVITIGASAFSQNKLTTLTLSNALETIEKDAFKENLLTAVTFPNSLKDLGKTAFSNNSISSITWGTGLTKLEQGVFGWNQLTELSIPDGITSIGNYAFRENKISQLTLPNTLTSIGIVAFMYNELSEVNIPSSVVKIDGGAFNHNKITKVNNVESDGIIYARNADGSDDISTIVSYGGTKTIVDFIPNTTKTIGSNAFIFNELTEVSLPASIVRIEENSFYSNSLSNITIPNSVSHIGSRAFGSNTITTINLPSNVRNYRNEVWKDENDNQVTVITDLDLAYNVEGDVVYNTITFDAGIGTLNENGNLNDLTFDEAISVAPGVSPEAGYSFDKWDISENDIVNYSLTLTAQYKIADYTITYNTDGGTHSNPDTYNVESENITLGDATKAGVTFEGWYSNAEFTGDIVTKIANGSYGNVELWAKYETATAIDNTNANSFKAYPNPTTGIIYLEGVELGDAYAIYSLAGSMVQQGVINSKELNLTNLKKGVYMLKVSKQITMITKK